MSTKHLFVILLINFFHAHSQQRDFRVPRSLSELQVAYVVLTEGSSGKNYPRFISEISIFDRPSQNVHVGDITPLQLPFVDNYYQDSQESRDVGKVEIDVEQMEKLPCNFVDPLTNQVYYFVRFEKKIFNRGGKLTDTEIQYLKIQDKDYSPKIEEVFDDSVPNRAYYINPCMQEVLDAKEKLEVSLKIESFQQRAIQFYSEKDYLNALLTLNEASKLGPKNSTTLEYLDIVNKKIDDSFANSEFEKALLINSKQAQDLLISLNNYTSLSPSLIDRLQNKLTAKIKTEQQNTTFNEAKFYIKENMHQRALPLLLKLSREGFVNENLNYLIKSCKEADPRYVQNKLTEAYNAAVASRKNANQTFKTYYKYEKSGLLNGDNYKWMCIMMSGSGNKRLLKEMNISSNQSKNLAISYYYKAKNLGENVNDLKVILFTKNFDKK